MNNVDNESKLGYLIFGLLAFYIALVLSWSVVIHIDTITTDECLREWGDTTLGYECCLLDHSCRHLNENVDWGYDNCGLSKIYVKSTGYYEERECSR